MSIYKRWQYSNLLSALATRRVILLSGPRQCGKTTLTKQLDILDSIYRTLDDVTLLEAASTDPRGFVKHNDELMIIDEVQRAPIILQAIKQDVDENTKYGRFLLTGSANVQSLPGVSESLAGRISKIRLRPLSQGEIHNNPANFLVKAFAQDFGNGTSIYDKDDYISISLKGGFPEALLFTKLQQTQRWCMDYIDAMIERDLHDIINIRRQESIRELLFVLAAWSSKYMDLSAICSGLELSRPTIGAYINALEALYLVERVIPWTKTDYERVGKHSKLYMTDSGIMSAILKFSLDKVRLDGDLNGKLLETFVFTQLAALIDAGDNQYKLYQYRDREKREIDFIIEDDNHGILGIEVKSSSRISISDFKHLKWFKNTLITNQKFVGIVLYTGENIARFGEDMWAIPISLLWSN